MKKYFINLFYFYTGILFLLLSKIRYKLFGYSPKPFSVTEIKRCIEYDIHVVNKWLECLNEYAPNYEIQNKHILELGPGSDLGIGLYLLSKSVRKYTAVDVHDLVSSVSADFYDSFFTHLRSQQIDTVLLEEELRKTRNHNNDKLNYVQRADFDLIKAIGDDKVDVIFSNAAFEHFQDIEKTICDISKITALGSVLIVSIDLQTHSRWIGKKDPNNIYRYSEKLYNILSFCSSPNRVRPYQYKELLEQNGWKNVVIRPLSCLDNERLIYIHDHLDNKFQDAINQMNFLSVHIYATKG